MRNRNLNYILCWVVLVIGIVLSDNVFGTTTATADKVFTSALTLFVHWAWRGDVLAAAWTKVRSADWLGWLVALAPVLTIIGLSAVILSNCMGWQLPIGV